MSELLHSHSRSR